jgi:hypothetical protein
MGSPRSMLLILNKLAINSAIVFIEKKAIACKIYS